MTSLCFIDYKSVFDNVNYKKLLEILEEVRISESELRLISNLYWNQLSSISVKGEISEEVLIKKGVRQGCVLSPIVFNLYSENIFPEDLDATNDVLVINDEWINNIKHADDSVIMTRDLVALENKYVITGL